MRRSSTADRMDVARQIFGDVDVAKTLVHNVASQESVLAATDAWIDSLAIDGRRNAGNPEYTGLWTIRDKAKRNQFVGIRGVLFAPGLPENSVATFVAVAKPYWGSGVSSDSSVLLCRHVFEKSGLDAIYTRVWPMLNPASDRVQRRLGFVPAERQTLRDTFGEKRMREVLGFDLWRASMLPDEGFQDALRQVSIRIGQLAAEDLIERQTAAERIMAALPPSLTKSSDVQGLLDDALRLGYQNPAWACYRLSRNNWSMSALD